MMTVILEQLGAQQQLVAGASTTPSGRHQRADALRRGRGRGMPTLTARVRVTRSIRATSRVR